MSVYVDDMHKFPMGKFRRMKMSHMIADSEDELHKMALAIGVARKWYQGPPKTSMAHYDICLEMRNKALALGAIEVTMRQLGAMNYVRRSLSGDKGKLPAPEKAEAMMKKLFANRHKQELEI